MLTMWYRTIGGGEWVLAMGGFTTAADAWAWVDQTFGAARVLFMFELRGEA